jgi:hypothetical protein
VVSFQLPAGAGLVTKPYGFSAPLLVQYGRNALYKSFKSMVKVRKCFAINKRQGGVGGVGQFGKDRALSYALNEWLG